MRKVLFADFNDLSDYPEAEIRQGIPLGLERDIPALQELREHEQVILDMPGDLQADGYVTYRVIPQGRYWYGVITGNVRYYDELVGSDQAQAAS